jgi:hypothetical protein
VPSDLADWYQVRVKMRAGPFAVDDSQPTIIPKSQLLPAKEAVKK